MSSRLDPACGYEGQPGYRACTCQLCTDAVERGCRPMALRITSDPNPMPTFRLRG